jgi:sugar phosphate isomerase/epimerase
MLLGYNTNGFAHHRLEDALVVLAELGYESVAITLDYHALSPYDKGLGEQTARVRDILAEKNLRCVVETGARFLLDPRRKHQPTLVSELGQDRLRRLDFLRRAVDIARELQADAVSFWSGAAESPASPATLMARLVEGCQSLCDHAAAGSVRLAFEPEPGMFIDRMDGFAELYDRIGERLLGLTLDIGHLYCQGELPIAAHLHRWRRLLWNVHIEDMRRGVHEHLMFGEGEIDFKSVLGTLREIEYAGGVHVELSRHSHDAVATARQALALLRDPA